WPSQQVLAVSSTPAADEDVTAADDDGVCRHEGGDVRALLPSGMFFLYVLVLTMEALVLSALHPRAQVVVDRLRHLRLDGDLILSEQVLPDARRIELRESSRLMEAPLWKQLQVEA